jgi:hypothetical protein
MAYFAVGRAHGLLKRVHLDWHVSKHSAVEQEAQAHCHTCISSTKDRSPGDPVVYVARKAAPCLPSTDAALRNIS